MRPYRERLPGVLNVDEDYIGLRVEVNGNQGQISAYDSGALVLEIDFENGCRTSGTLSKALPPLIEMCVIHGELEI